MIILINIYIYIKFIIIIKIIIKKKELDIRCINQNPIQFFFLFENIFTNEKGKHLLNRFNGEISFKNSRNFENFTFY